MAENSRLTCGRLPSGNSPGRKNLTSKPLKWGLKWTQNVSRNRKVYLAQQPESDDTVRIIAVGGLAGLLRDVVAEAPPRGVPALALRVEALSKDHSNMAKA